MVKIEVVKIMKKVIFFVFNVKFEALNLRSRDRCQQATWRQPTNNVDLKLLQMIVVMIP